MRRLVDRIQADRCMVQDNVRGVTNSCCLSVIDLALVILDDR